MENKNDDNNGVSHQQGRAPSLITVLVLDCHQRKGSPVTLSSSAAPTSPVKSILANLSRLIPGHSPVKSTNPSQQQESEMPKGKSKSQSVEAIQLEEKTDKETADGEEEGDAEEDDEEEGEGEEYEVENIVDHKSNSVSGSLADVSLY
jgi:hypothetical protein